MIGVMFDLIYELELEYFYYLNIYEQKRNSYKNYIWNEYILSFFEIFMWLKYNKENVFFYQDVIFEIDGKLYFFIKSFFKYLNNYIS